MITDPEAIEKRSFEIIEKLLAARQANPRSPEENLVLKRVIHTSADFDYEKNLLFTNDAARCGIAILHDHPSIVTDTQMALSGINKKTVAKYGGEVRCFMADADVAEAAKQNSSTRAAAAVDKAAAEMSAPVFVIGNAPTALIRICELIREERLAPRLIIGTPVGFVNVTESKEMLKDLEIPCIITQGNKGGSNIAAAIVNALIYQNGGRD
jgi:precorrin-8X/cobalt-precorrin-8 methylmutase